MKQVLLVEPDFFPRVAIDDQLAPHGWNVVPVKRIRDALIKLKTQVFSLILMSYEDVDPALRFLATLRHNHNSIPVLLLTKNPTQEDLIRLSTFPPLEVIIKPYSLHDLIKRMEETVAERAS
ncbi:response regulator [Acanthopleuribacter pedis]|uniref:Response regulator n=1 Tax=Acanthopleuribacter pedis TaxID=442870 RepID=A0A8J7QEF0_9BACT|nr:response regulator [Acanthopleuribacter pedis]MBO1322719.1 response regulator [Acanthopleuribacter pedis]